MPNPDNTVPTFSYFQYWLEYATIRVLQRARRLIDLVGIGSSTLGRLCCGFLFAAMLFFAGLLASKAFSWDPANGLRISSALSCLVIVPSLFLIVWPADTSLEKRRIELDDLWPELELGLKRYELAVESKRRAKAREKAERQRAKDTLRKQQLAIVQATRDRKATEEQHAPAPQANGYICPYCGSWFASPVVVKENVNPGWAFATGGLGFVVFFLLCFWLLPLLFLLATARTYTLCPFCRGNVRCQ